jgi:hypothetical protein
MNETVNETPPSPEEVQKKLQEFMRLRNFSAIVSSMGKTGCQASSWAFPFTQSKTSKALDPAMALFPSE